MTTPAENTIRYACGHEVYTPGLFGAVAPGRIETSMCSACEDAAREARRAEVAARCRAAVYARVATLDAVREATLVNVCQAAGAAAEWDDADTIVAWVGALRWDTPALWATLGGIQGWTPRSAGLAGMRRTWRRLEA